MVAASLGGAGIAPHSSVAQRPSAHASSDAAAVISGLDRDHTTKSPMRPDTRPSSLATTAVSTPERPRRYLPPDTELQGGHSGAVRFPVMLAKLAVFTDVLLSGLVWPSSINQQPIGQFKLTRRPGHPPDPLNSREQD
jgi:hypothetical protein